MSTPELVLLGYQGLITAVILGLLWVTLLNLLHFKRLPLRGRMDRAAAPLVSILIPARNEERCIEACVQSVCSQHYPAVEVIVLNDHSTDATGEILRRLQVKYPSLRVLDGSPLPDGWVGKSWACQQLSEQATGEYLLFTDADTVHGPETVGASVDLAHEHRLDLFSMIPFEEMGTFAEHAVIPMVHMLYFSYLPNHLILNDRRTSLSAANGQFMFFRAEAYRDIGGHTAVHDALVEDVFLAKAMKGAGKRIALVDGSRHVWCRMYTSAREVTRGFSKNLFAGTGYNLPLTLLFLVHLITAFVVPVVFVLTSAYLLTTTPRAMMSAAYEWGLFALPATQIMIVAIIRLMIARRFGMPWWHLFLQPITAIWTVIIGINAIRWAYSARGSEWKGRHYTRQRTL